MMLIHMRGTIKREGKEREGKRGHIDNIHSEENFNQIVFLSFVAERLSCYLNL